MSWSHSTAAIKCSDQNLLTEDRVYLPYSSRAQSSTEGSQGKDSRQEPGRNTACWLARWLLLILLAYVAQNHLHEE